MDNDILDSLNDLGYTGPLTDEASFSKALDGGPKSLEFTKLVHILAEELKQLCSLEETVNMMNDPDESSSFLLELSSFLKELRCPYKKLVTGHMSSRLDTKEDRVLLLDYLISELMAARIVGIDRPKEKTGMEIVMQESPTAKDLKEILIALKFNKPPPNITAEMLFSKLESKLKDTMQKEGDQLVGKPLYNKAMTEKDWKQLETAFSDMYEEYRLRRETLITRLECTVQSFEWSDRLKTKKDVIQSAYRPKRDQLKLKPDVKLSDFLAARTSLLHVEKTSSATVRKNTQSDVNKVIIGQVPDRGGRPNEAQPPPPEMPSWQQRSAGPQGGGRGGMGGGGGGRGGIGGGGRGDPKPARHPSTRTKISATTKPTRFPLAVTASTTITRATSSKATKGASMRGVTITRGDKILEGVIRPRADIKIKLAVATKPTKPRATRTKATRATRTQATRATRIQATRVPRATKGEGIRTNTTIVLTGGGGEGTGGGGGVESRGSIC